MKVLGAKQLSQIRHKYLEINNEDIQGILGRVPKYFKMVVYGDSGNGKTEFVMQTVKVLCPCYRKIAWMSYEQGHEADFTEACDRNNMVEVSGKFLGVDPFKNLKDGVSLLDDLFVFLDKRNSPDAVVMDSLDDTEFNKKEYTQLVKRYEGKKTFIFLVKSSKTGAIQKSVCQHARFHCQLAIWVSNYIAHPTNKNRFGAYKPYVVYEEKARELNPAFFSKRVRNGKKPTNGKKKKTPKKGITIRVPWK